MYCSADVHFIEFYLLALRDAFPKVQDGKIIHRKILNW